MLRGVVVYLVLLLFRLTGKRALSQLTTFDFVILLIVGEASQQALPGEDFSVAQASLVIATMLLLDQVKWAVLETSGGISVVPRWQAAPRE